MLKYKLVALILVLGIFTFAYFHFQSVSAPGLSCQNQIELGELNYGTQYEGGFLLKNIGNAPLQIYNFRTSCSCAGVEVLDNGKYKSVKTATIAPGSEVTFKLRISVVGRPGSQQLVAVYFETNDSKHKEHSININISNVKSQTVVDPSFLVLGNIDRDSKRMYHIAVYDYTGNRDAAQIAVRAKPEGRLKLHFEPYKDGRAAMADGRREVGKIIVTPNSISDEINELNSTIELYETGSDAVLAAVQVTGRCDAPFDINPSKIFLPIVSNSKKVYISSAILSSKPNTTLTISEIKSPDFISLNRQFASANSCELTNAINEPVAMWRGSHIIIIYFTIDNNPFQLKIPCVIE